MPPLATNVCEYVAPTIPGGSDDVVTVNGGAVIVILRFCVSVAFELSFTCTVKLGLPAAVGVPVIAPLAASDRPAGSAPAVLDQLLPPVPPLAESVWLYPTPTVPAGSDVVVTASGGGAMVMLRAWVSVSFELSFT